MRSREDRLSRRFSATTLTTSSSALACRRAKIPLLAAGRGFIQRDRIIADVFFAPAIRTISKMFKLLDDVAGATLLALGGSVPDIFTQLAAISAKNQILIGMSESVGAGIYVCSFVRR